MAKLDSKLLVLLPLALIHQIAQVTGLSKSSCFTGQQRALEINCGTGYMLHITNAFYGYSYTNTCSFRAGDCIQAEHVAYPCIGRANCSINLPSGTVGKKLQNCDKDSTYFQVEYSCQPVVQTMDICRSTVLTSQRGFISTPRYPNNYRDNLDCLTRVKVDQSQNINITVIDMDLDSNGTYGCNDWMYAYNQFRSVTLCGRRTNEKLYTLQTNEITMRFQSDAQLNKKGFWIYYEAYPPLPPKTTEKVTDQPSVSTTQKPVVRPPDPENTNTNTGTQKGNQATESKEKLPFVAIVSGVIGTLTFILIVLLTLLVYRWWQDKQTCTYKHKTHDIEYLDARNPAFRSSTGTEFSGIEIYYNC